MRERATRGRREVAALLSIECHFYTYKLNERINNKATDTMRTFVAVIALVLFGFTSAQAQALTVDTLRPLVLAGDVEGVEAAFAQHQAAFLSGTVHASESRAPYELFKTTHPDVLAFSGDWLREIPNSAYAQTARAVSLFHIGWIVRGSRYARDTHPRAFEEHYSMHRDANALAFEAYYANPDLLAASDMVIKLANTGGSKDHAIEVLLEVMEQRPNYGTIRSGFDLVRRGYGGTPEVGEYLCSELAALVVGETYDVGRYCMMDLMAYLEVYDDWPERMAVLLEQGDVPDFDYFQYLVWINTLPSTKETAAKIHTYMQNDEFTEVSDAQKFDIYIAYPFGYNLMEYVVLDHAKAEARRTLVNDPMNLEALDLLERGSMIATKNETGHSMRPVPSDISAEVKIEYAKRRVFIAPYDGDQWVALAELSERHASKDGPKGYDLTAFDDYYVNAVYYGRNGYQYLAAMRASKARQLLGFDAVMADPADAQGWKGSLENVDRDVDLLCPLIRVDRLMIEVAGLTRATRPDEDGTAEAMEVYYVDAEKRGVCDVALNSDVANLHFEQPVEVPVMTDFGSLTVRLN
ncbi:MAG: hypothetical protein V7695_14635 [Sulfitobacter sp.]